MCLDLLCVYEASMLADEPAVLWISVSILILKMKGFSKIMFL